MKPLIFCPSVVMSLIVSIFPNRCSEASLFCSAAQIVIGGLHRCNKLAEWFEQNDQRVSLILINESLTMHLNQ